MLLFLSQQSQREYPLKVLDQRQLRCVADIRLEHIVQHRQSRRGIEIIANRFNKFAAEFLHLRRIRLALRPQRANPAEKLLIGCRYIIQYVIAELQRLTIMGLQAEHPVYQRIIPFLLQ